MTITRSQTPSGFLAIEDLGERSDVLCVALDQAGARAAVPVAARRAGELGGGAFVIAAYRPLFAWASTMSSVVGLPLIDPAETSAAEISRLAGEFSSRVRSVWLPERKRVCEVAGAVLGEGCYAAAFVGSGDPSLADLAGSVLERTGRYCTAVSVETAARRP
jgi:hypothetical protein